MTDGPEEGIVHGNTIAMDGPGGTNYSKGDRLHQHQHKNSLGDQLSIVWQSYTVFLLNIEPKSDAQIQC